VRNRVRSNKTGGHEAARFAVGATRVSVVAALTVAILIVALASEVEEVEEIA